METKLLCYIFILSILNFNLTYGTIEFGIPNCSSYEEFQGNFYCHECKKFSTNNELYKNCLNSWLDLPKIKQKVLAHFYGFYDKHLLEAAKILHSMPNEYEKLKNCWLTNNCELISVKAKNKLADYKKRDSN
jgi:hypothetical protein